MRKKIVHAGQLSETIKISRPTRDPNGSGGGDFIYTEILTTYAGVEENEPNNDLIAQQADIIQVFKFKIRYRQDVKIKIADIIEWRGRKLEILGFNGSFLNRQYIEIKAKAQLETTDNGEV